MKQADINRLERAVKHYKKVEKALEAAYQSMDIGLTEYLPNEHLRMSTDHLVYTMYKDAKTNREWIENRIVELKELVK